MPCVMFCYLTGALVTNRVLCLVPLVAWFEDWMFVRQFKMQDIVYTTIEVVGKTSTVICNIFSMLVQIPPGSKFSLPCGITPKFPLTG